MRLSSTRRTLAYMSKVALDEQSAVGAVANEHSLKQALLELDAWGKALHGLFHSHPGAGVLATRPSSIDLATHERYERRYPLVGCIFVRDGHVRFFRHTSEPFQITICGTGVVPVAEDEHVFKIQHPSQSRFVSYETLATQE
jgi:proteasome lid subunit RPN8/RPN11